MSSSTSRVSIGLLVVCLPWLAACAGEAAGDVDRAVWTVQAGTVKPTVLLTGSLVAEEAVSLIAPNADIWPVTVRWLAEEGSEVAAEAPVVEFDNSQLLSRLESLRADVVAASNKLAQTRAKASSDLSSAALELARQQAALDKARLQAATPKELSSEQEWARRALEVEKAELEHDQARRASEATRASAEAAIDVDRLALDKARLALDRAERGLAVLTLRAPRGGIVLIEENQQEGRIFRSGDTTWPGTTVASLPNLATLRVEARLFDVDDGRIAAGDRVRATLDAFPGETLAGTVRKVSSFADLTGARSVRRAFQVVVDLEGIDPERMRPGMSVKLEVERPAVEGLVLPRAALRFADPPGSAVAWARQADGGRVEVEIGACDAQLCVLVSGLEAGRQLSAWTARDAIVAAGGAP